MGLYTITRRLIEPQNLMPAVMGATGAGMTVMMLLFMTPLGGNIWVVLFLFLGTIALVLSIFIRNATYTMDADGIKEELDPWQRFIKIGKPSVKYYRWNHVKSYKDDTDMSRSLRSIAYIHLWMNDGYQIKISQKSNEDVDPAFFAFREQFRLLIALHNQPAPPPQATSEPAYPHYVTDPITSTVKLDTIREVFTNEPIKTDISKPRHFIEKKGSFYPTKFGKLVTVFFCLLTAVLIYVVATVSTSGETLAINLFRLLFVLIPGCIYLVYRSFVKTE